MYQHAHGAFACRYSCLCLLFCLFFNAPLIPGSESCERLLLQGSILTQTKAYHGRMTPEELIF
jgi:hypothetical protein